MIANNNKTLDDNFMMSIFDKIGNDVSLFTDYIKHMYENKITALIVNKIKSSLFCVFTRRSFFSKV